MLDLTVPVRRLLSALVVLAVAATLLVLPTAPADASTCALNTAAEKDSVTRINSERKSRSIRTLATNTELRTVARNWSLTMCKQGKLYHNPKLGSQVKNWRVVGENVGRGSTVSSIHTAFMKSPGHRANILDKRYTQVGVGVYKKGSTLWLTQVFRQPR